MTGMTTLSEDSASAWKNNDSFDVDREESLLEYPASTELKGWKAGLVWVWISSIPREIVCGMLKSRQIFALKYLKQFE